VEQYLLVRRIGLGYRVDFRRLKKSEEQQQKMCTITNHSFDDTQSNAVLHFVKSDRH